MAPFGNGGGLDACCHQDRKHGGYHCHRGSFAGEAFTSKAQMLDSIDGKRPRSPAAESPPVAPATPPLPAAADCAKIKDAGAARVQDALTGLKCAWLLAETKTPPRARGQ
jgi:hypothetical protein